MNGNSKSNFFYYGHLILTSLIAIVIVLLHYLTKSFYDLPINTGSVIWASLITLVAYIISSRTLHGTPGEFSNGVMISMMIKMLLSLGFIGLILFFTQVNKKSFIASYFSSFFLLGFFEIYCLLNNLRPK